MEIEEFKLKDGRIVNIKRLTMEDYDADNGYEYVHDWLNKVNKFLVYEFEKKDIGRDKEEWYKYLSNESVIVIGALYNNKIIGTSSLRTNFRIKKQRHIGSWGIAIHPEFHNQGLGTKLLTIIEDLAKEKGLKKLIADFSDGNKSAEILYLKKMNYEVEGRQKHVILLKDGTYTDRVLIGKIIDDSMKE